MSDVREPDVATALFGGTEATDAVLARCRAQAEMMDVPLRVWLTRTLAGVFATQNAHRMYEAGVPVVAIHTKRQAVRQVPWIVEPGPPRAGGAAGPATYRYNGWELTRLGDPFTEAHGAEPGAGWYLSGPGLPEPVNLGGEGTEARREAAIAIWRYEAAQAARKEG